MRARPLALLLLLVATSCGDPTVVCGCLPPSTEAVLRGTVLDAQMSPVGGARVAPIFVLRVHCASQVAAMSANFAEVPTDVGGFFSLRLSTYEPGDHCVELIVASADLTAADTIGDLPVSFVGFGLPPDTTDVELQVTWR